MNWLIYVVLFFLVVAAHYIPWGRVRVLSGRDGQPPRFVCFLCSMWVLVVAFGAWLWTNTRPVTLGDAFLFLVFAAVAASLGEGISSLFDLLNENQVLRKDAEDYEQALKTHSQTS